MQVMFIICRINIVVLYFPFLPMPKIRFSFDFGDTTCLDAKV